MPADAFGQLVFSPGGEEWVEFDAPEGRRRVELHDYAALYGTPGLYERVFERELGMCSAQEVVGALADALREAGVDPAPLRVLDFGAGNGAGGERLRAVGVGEVVGLDLEPAARTAAERDRPGVYSGYVVADLGALSEDELAELRGPGFDALVAVASLGFGHVPADVLERAVGLVRPGGWLALAMNEQLLPGTAGEEGQATGYPALLASLLDGTRATEVLRRPYVHRVHTDGSPHPAQAVVCRLV